MFRQLIEAAPDAVVVADDRGQNVLINRRAEELVGYPREARHREDLSRAPSTRPMGAGLELSAVRPELRGLDGATYGL